MFNLDTDNTNSSTSILSVDPQTYAELVSVSSDIYKFSFTFGLKISVDNKDARDYDRVVITVSRKSRDQYSNSDSNFSSEKSTQELNKTDYVSFQDYVKPNSDKIVDVVPENISKKLFSGLKLVKDSVRQEDFLERKEVFLAPHVENVLFNRFSHIELFSPRNTDIKESKRIKDVDLRSGNTSTSKSSRDKDTPHVDATKLLSRINQEICDITLPVTDPKLSLLTSESLIDGPSIRMSCIQEGKSALYFDIMKFYLDEVKSSPEEKNMKTYSTKSVVKYLDSVEVKSDLILKASTKNQVLVVSFELYKKESRLPEETLMLDLDIQPHIEAYESIIDCPKVSATKSTFVDGMTFSKTSKKLYNITVTDQDKSGRVDSFNLYLKTIQASGGVTDYSFLKKLNNTGVVKTELEINDNLCSLRVVPVDSLGIESNVFTNLILGDGHDFIGSLTCLPYHYGNNEIRVDILGLPTNVLSVTLYKRDCTDNIDSSFSAVASSGLQRGVSSITLVDKDIIFSRTYEYYAVVVAQDEETIREISIFSNFSSIRSLSNGVPGKSLTVFFSNADTKKSDKRNELNVSFNLKTELTPAENERITKTLKDQIGELYKQFLDPLANSSSPLGDDKGVPKYADLILHEVVRYNLTTGEKETFDLISDGLFEDNTVSQKNSNVKPLNPYHEYEYKVFTFRKNPIELFKNFVAKGVDSKSKKSEWFYSPYKWRNPSERLGKLYAQDEKGNVVIDSYDNFTSECYGLTASHRVSPYSKIPTINRVYAERIDRNTVKISWSQNNSFDYQSEFFDCFVVLKVVNRVRSFVGRTKNNFIYHELTQKDLGTVYYIVVPITSKFSIDAVHYSDTVLVSPEAIVEKVKIASSSISKNTTSL